jgi:MSHA pilin protein MshC
MRTQRGFTLAELIIVLVLISILAAVAVPRMFDMEQFSARGTRDFVGASLRYAQKSAIAMRRNVCVVVTATEMEMTFASASGINQPCPPPPPVPGDPPPNAVLNPGNGLHYSHDSNKFPAKAPVSTPVNLIFDAQGRPLSAPSTPMLSALSISVTGHATPLTIEPETGTVR